jgi:hypothetical protein
VDKLRSLNDPYPIHFFENELNLEELEERLEMDRIGIGTGIDCGWCLCIEGYQCGHCWCKDKCWLNF